MSGLDTEGIPVKPDIIFLHMLTELVIFCISVLRVQLLSLLILHVVLLAVLNEACNTSPSGRGM